VKLKKNLNAVASSLHLSLSRLPDAFQKFTKFYQFRGGYHSSLGAPMFHLQLKKMFVFNTTFKLFGAETCVTEIQQVSNISPFV